MAENAQHIRAGPVNALWVARYDYWPGWEVPPHTHEFFQLICTIGGRGITLVGGKEYAMEEDTVTLISPRTSHAIRAQDNELLKTLDTKFHVLDAHMTRQLLRTSTVYEDNERFVRHILSRIRSEGTNKAAWYQYVCDALLIECLVAIMDRGNIYHKEPAALAITHFGDSAIRAVADFVRVNFSQEIDCGVLAEYVGYSPEYLSKRFKKATGTSLHEYVLQVRIENAKSKMECEGLTVKEAAFSVGFKSIHHFTRVFREIEGLPPATWRDRQLEDVWRDVVITPGFSNRDLTITE